MIIKPFEKTNKKITMNDLEYFSIFVLAAFIICIGIYLFYKYKKSLLSSTFSNNNNNNNTSATERFNMKRQEQRAKISPHYKPEEVGRRTGVFRVFNTNKGLKTYEINGEGYPLPQQISTL